MYIARLYNFLTYSISFSLTLFLLFSSVFGLLFSSSFLSLSCSVSHFFFLTSLSAVVLYPRVISFSFLICFSSLFVAHSLSLSLWLHVFVYRYFHQFFLFIFSSSFVISLLRFLHLHFSLLYRSIFFIFRSFKTANKFFLFQASFLLFQKLTLAIKCHYKRLSKRITINHVSLASRIKLSKATLA